MDDQPSPRELAREHAGVASAPAGAAPGSGVGPGAGEHGLRGRTGEPGTSGGTPPGRNTRFVETSRGVLTYAELAPLLGERVLACEEAIVTGAFTGQPLDEHLLRQFHHRISAGLVPDWAGRWRTVEVQAELAATGDTERNEYFAALEPADRLDWQPLSAIWQRRFEQFPPPATSP